MAKDSNAVLAVREVDRVHKPKMLKAGTVNKVHDAEEIEDPLEKSRAAVGAVIKEGVGAGPLKTYGPKSQMSGLVSGANVPDYLARLYEDEDARLRFGRAWLGDDRRVRVRTVIEWDEEKAG